MTMRELSDRRPRRLASASPLAAAHDDLLRRCHAAERAGDWQEGIILSALVDVADYLKRIGDNPDSTHYRAEKAGALLTAAIRVYRDAMLAYGDWPEDDPNENVVLAASRVLEDVAERVKQTMWQAVHTARGEPDATSRSEADDFVHVGRQLARWAARHRTERSVEVSDCDVITHTLPVPRSTGWRSRGNSWPSPRSSHDRHREDLADSGGISP